MLQAKVVSYDTSCKGQISEEEDASMLSALMEKTGCSKEDVDFAVNYGKLDSSLDYSKITFVARCFEHKIVHVQDHQFNHPFQQFLVVYDDEIAASYDENFETVEEQFIMNKF